ncbi:MAG: DNA repair protein RecN [Chitinophagaceae bacterium]|nr:DNA repair protein RecN [Chitinophagaceae bacterium]MCW5929439.1 DNA repair protein RecN [Chitinophagaceae bacterium]
MLLKLLIRNYAIIAGVEIDFSKGLNIITGETGAGKSILVGALGLILGERADSSVLQDTGQKCIAEGIFNIKNHPGVKAFLQENELDEEEELTIRREVAANGKSRAFINDTPVTLVQLKQVTSLLVDMHQQFDTLQLGNDDFQREVMDGLADNGALLKKYREAYSRYSHIRKELKEAKEQQAAFTKEKDYYTFLHRELEEANLQENELEDAEQALKLLNNAEQIKSSLSKIYYDLNEGEQPVVQQLKTLGNLLQSLSEYHAEVPPLVQRLLSAQIELKDIANEIDRLNDNVGLDAAKLEELSERLSIGYKLQKKHGVQTTAELLTIRAELQEKLNHSLDLDATISRMEKELDAGLQAAKKLAAELSAQRKKQVTPLEKQTTRLLNQVGMPNARIKVQIEEAPLDANGSDNISFLFDANNSNRFEPLRKVASGGELSRLMLCIKSLVAASVKLPTLIFDEIDTGISGEAAKQVGVIMKDLGRSHQVIAITHQPQIAARAETHLFVYKKQTGGAINTHIRILAGEERVHAIAQMLGGEKPSVSALENAKEMIGMD